MKNLNVIQTLSVTGIVFSIIVHIILTLINKHIDFIWALYPTWVIVFIIGYIFRVLQKDEDDHHHH